MVALYEVVRRCPHCRRESNLAPREYEENPFCSVCIDERHSAANDRLDGIFKRVQSGSYCLLVPTAQTALEDA
jgi:hypothetical protein